jgi:peptide/nickel transport system substrate-binding protein
VKRSYIAVVGGIVLGVAAAVFWMRDAGTDTAPAGSAEVAAGGGLSSTVRSDPRSFNRYLGTDTTSGLVAVLTQAPLLRINRATDQWEYWLAESSTSEPDGLNYTLALRHGVTFSDGTPFSAADVVFTFAMLYDERFASPAIDGLRVAGKPLTLTPIDDHSVRVTFPSRFGPGLRILDNVPILPKHKLEAAMREGRLREVWGPATLPAELTGMGPFVLAEYVAGQRLAFARNTRYWRRDASGRTLPYLDRIVIDIVPDQNTEVLRLENGQSDFLPTEVRPEDYAALKRSASSGRLTLHDLGVSPDADFLWINLIPAAAKADPRTPWLRSRQLRHAIAHAVDRQAFADTVLLGAGVPVQGPVTPANKTWFAPDIPTYVYDPARAQALLKEVGLRDTDGDGMFEDASGTPARFALLTQKGRTPRERGAAVLQDALRKIGLTVDVVALEFGALIDRFSTGRYDAMYFGTESSDPDPSAHMEFWLSSGGFHVWNPGQSAPATEWEREIDTVMQQQVASSDLAERKRLFARAQRILATELPVIHFVVPRLYVATSRRVANAMPVIYKPYLLWNAELLAARPDTTTRAGSGLR